MFVLGWRPVRLNRLPSAVTLAHTSDEWFRSTVGLSVAEMERGREQAGNGNRGRTKNASILNEAFEWLDWAEQAREVTG